MRAAALIAITVSILAGYATAEGVGPLFQPQAMLSNLQVNLFMLSLAMTFNLVGCFSEQNRNSVERLRIEHALLAKAEEIAGVGSWEYDAVTHREQWSQQFYRLLGLLPDEIPPNVSELCERFVVPEDRARFLESWESFARTGQPNRIEFRIRRTDHRERVVVGHADVQRDPRGRPSRFVGTLRDVTERRQALEDRQRMQELLNKAEEIARLGSWEMDGCGNMPRWSENMYRICGVEVGDFDGSFQTFLSRFVHPDDRTRVESGFRHFARGLESDWTEYRIVRGDGEIRDVQAHVRVARRENGHLVRCYGTTTDVTEHKHVERQLRESEQRYRLLADYASDMITRIREDGTVADVSPACKKILGHEPEEITGQPLMNIVVPEDRDRCGEVLAQLLAGESRPARTFRGLRKDESPVWLESKSQLIVDDAGKRQLICVTRDITERLALEEQIAQAQRLEAIGRLAGGIAHDFNNILTVINGYAEILEMRFAPDDPAAKHVARILEAGQRAAELTRQLLAYGRKQLVTRGLVDLNALIQKLNPLFKPLIGERIELVQWLQPKLALIEGSEAQIEQLVMNLVINARDAMPDGGQLTLETKTVELAPPEASRRLRPPGIYVKFIVADTGDGMSDDVKARVFEPFFTTKRIGQGTGLGLASVHATVVQYGGIIEVDSAPGKGTRFELYFPAHASSALAEPVPSPPRERFAPEACGRRILIVEDDEHVRSLVQMTLSRAKYDVVSASSGEEALQLVAADPKPFDLLLTDAVMKGINGRELADSLRTRDPRLAVIFMSGHTEDEVIRHGVLNDELTFLQKPFSSEELMNRVQQVFAGQAA